MLCSFLLPIGYELINVQNRAGMAAADYRAQPGALSAAWPSCSTSHRQLVPRAQKLHSITPKARLAR